MADIKFSELTALGDFIPGVKIAVLDTTDTTMSPSGTNKLMTAQNLLDVLAFTGASTGALTGAFYPRTSNPSGFVTSLQLDNYVTITGDQNISGIKYFYEGLYGLYNGVLVFDGINRLLVDSSSNASVLWDTRTLQDISGSDSVNWQGRILGGNWTVDAPAAAGHIVNLGYATGAFYPRSNPSGFITSAQTGAFASDLEVTAAIAALSTVYYPKATNPSGYLTGIIAGTNITVVNNGVGGFTVNSTASGSSSTGELTGVFYPLNSNPSGYIQSTSGNVTVQGGATILNGQLLIGNSGDNSFTQGGLVGGSGVYIVSGAGSLTINSIFTGIIAGNNITVTSSNGGYTINSTASGSSSSTPFAWNSVTGATTIAFGSGYICSGAPSRVVLTLPTGATVGQYFKAASVATGGFRVAQNANQIIYFADSNSTAGVSGYIESTATRNSVEVVCISANTAFQVVSSVGNISLI